MTVYLGQSFSHVLPVMDWMIDVHGGGGLESRTVLSDLEEALEREWSDIVRCAGGIAIGPPEKIRRIPNLRYGLPLITGAGTPLVDGAGLPVRDRCRYILIARGRAIRTAVQV